MKEKKTLVRKLLDRVKASAVKVDKRAKKSFAAAAKGQGVSKKRIKEVLKKQKPTAHSQSSRSSAKAPETPENTGFGLGDALRAARRAGAIAARLRTTGGRTIHRRGD